MVLHLLTLSKSQIVHVVGDIVQVIFKQDVSTASIDDEETASIPTITQSMRQDDESMIPFLIPFETPESANRV
jgi:hypothetical protein